MSALDTPVLLDGEAVRRFMFASGRPNQEEKVGYYRKPTHYVNSKGQTRKYKYGHWIETADTHALRWAEYVKRGWTPLPKYGHVTDSFDLWKPILAHPDGPAEFPLTQVLTFRWWKPECLPGSLMGRTDIYFPQLAEALARGEKYELIPCPDCEDDNVAFFEPHHLARHLVNRHGYDRAAIIALQDSMRKDGFDVDFNKSIRSIAAPQAINYSVTPPVRGVPLGDDPTVDELIKPVRVRSQRQHIGEEPPADGE